MEIKEYDFLAEKIGKLTFIYLKNGVKLHGRMNGFDKEIILLSSDDDKSMMIYKHSISTIAEDTQSSMEMLGKPIQYIPTPPKQKTKEKERLYD